MGLQIAEGLEAAHRAGVIHRDIKPDNIMVMGEESVEAVKLMDFGIARLRDAGAASRLTRADVIMGTPAYMAPEQAEGAEVSEQTDIYALGIVLYEMLSGSVPFKASTPSAVLVKADSRSAVATAKIAPRDSGIDRACGHAGVGKETPEAPARYARGRARTPKGGCRPRRGACRENNGGDTDSAKGRR